MIKILNKLKDSFIIFIFLFIELCGQEQDSFSQNEYPNTLTLLNGNIIMVSKIGIHFFDSTFTTEDDSKKIIFEKQITTSSDYSKTAMAQFPEEDDGYIIILALDIIYFFNRDGTNLFSKNISDYIYSDYYDLIPYKKVDNNLHYIISYRNKLINLKNFTINYFKYNIDSQLIDNIKVKTVNVSVQYSHNNNPNDFAGPSCLFLYPPSLTHEIFACFYSTFFPTEIHARVFNPINNFEELTEYFSYFSTDQSLEFFHYIKALTNEDKQKAFIYCNNKIPYSMTFDINNLLSQPYKLKNDDECNYDPNFPKNKFMYFKESQEFVAISGLYDCGVKLALISFNNDFSLKTKGNFQPPYDVYGMNAYSIIYKERNYSIVYDNRQNKIREGTITEYLPLPEASSPIPSTQIKTEEQTSTKNVKCKKETLESSNYDLCTECDTSNGYFSAEFNDNSFLHGFTECFNSDTKPLNFYFDNSDKIYKQCYETCKSCNGGGDINSNNCIECENNYIKKPGVPDTTTCVLKCNYFHYYNSYGEYKCTNNNICPEESKLLIKEINKCTNDCSKEDIYKFRYGGKCLEICPENTSPNPNNICINNNINSCSKSENEMNSKITLDISEVDINAKNYAEEFSYTIKHVSHYYNKIYSILFYKDLNCIEELFHNVNKVDFDACFKKVQENLNPPTDEKIIVALIEKLNSQKTTTTVYSFYHPITGEKLDIEAICKDMNFEVRKSVLPQLNSDILDDILFLTQQNIDIFNKSHEFYTDLCFIFDSPNGKDITLNDRMLTYYPNVSLCDDGCISDGVNLTSMESNCECQFNKLINNDLFNNKIVGQALGEVIDLISSSNLFVLKCYKEVFVKKNIINNIGGYIMIGIITVEIILTIIFFSMDMVKVFRYLYNLTKTYINSIKHKKKNLIKEENNFPTESAPPKKGDKKERHKNIKNFKILPYNYDYNKDILNSVKSDSSPRKSSRKNLKKNESQKDVSNGITIFNYEKVVNDISPNINSSKKGEDLCNDINIKEYLKPDLDEMEYDDAIKYDKRSFCVYYSDRLKDKQMFVNICCNKENLKPITIKILLLLLNIDLYFIVNGFFYNEEYISKLFHSDKKETFFSFFERSIGRLFYTTIVGVIVETIINWIFIDENRIKRIFRREKNNFVQLKNEIFQLIKNLKKRYIFFIILCFIIALFSWYYVNCFNNVYPGVKIEWVKSSITIILIMQILPIITAFIEAILRALSFKCKSETLFEIKKYFS